MFDLTNCKWIYAPSLTQDQVPVFQTAFQAAPDSHGTLTITALGIYEARLNGHRIGDFIFAPGWTHYTKRLQVQTYDLTPYLQEENILTVEVPQGWFCEEFGFPGIPEGSHTPLCLLADVALNEQGIIRRISTDESWQWHTGAWQYAHIYHGEVIDLSACENENQPVAIHPAPFHMLIEQEGEYIREMERLKPISCTLGQGGTWIMDFGQNLTGYVCFSLSAKGGEKLLIRHAEVLDSQGNLYTENLRDARAEMQITLKEGLNTLSRHHSFYGFRYISVSGWDGNLDPDCFTAVVVHSDMPRTGHFTCGVRDVNQLYHNIVWGQKSNYLDVPTDCPQRDERLGWTGDAQVFIKAGAYNYDVKKFFTKWLRDMKSEQRADGGIPHTIPDSARYTPDDGREYSSAWADAACICPWQLYENYGDTELLREHFPMMKKWVDHIRAQGDKEEVWDTGFHFADWLGLDAKEGDYTGSTDYYLIATAMYANSTRLLIQAGHVLEQDVSEYESLYPRIVNAYQERFLPKGKLLCRTQTAHILTLHFDLYQEKHRASIANELVQIIHEYNDHLTTGFVGTPYLLHVLTRHGYTDLAYKLLLNRTFPSWLFSVKMGATTMWEHWDSLKEDGSMWSSDMNSFNHYAYGAVGDWLFGVSAGINPASPGYESILFTPHPDKRMGYVSASYQTKYGKVESSWQWQEDRVAYTFTLPDGCTGKAVIGEEEMVIPAGKTTLIRMV
ncbi:MAG: family 78 glycoside hydrolase catalytic domain [Clostridia bacterium]|nr:family 78 glycoside hydrolase catalytic domain [Clostridia bacterium]